MPYYSFQDKNTNIIIEVQRKIKDIDVEPDKEEAINGGMEVEDYAEADWERIIPEDVAFTGDKGKGNW